MRFLLRVILTTMMVPGVIQADESWIDLLQGDTLEHWRGYSSEDIPAGWEVDNGTLMFSPGKGDLVTRESFKNFELQLEWKISEGGNSGVLYLAQLSDDPIYYSAPEMQILDDDRHQDGKDPLTSAGANYALHPAPRGVVAPAGDWNTVRIRHQDGQVEHWLNGEKIVEYTLGSADWESRVAASKFSEWPDYGRAREGFIGLQDHGNNVWFRNIRIRRL